MSVNIAIVICLAVSLAGVISACNSSEQYRILKFDTSGGSEIKDIVINICDTSNEILTQIPVKEGYLFSGWYFDCIDYQKPLNKSEIEVYSQEGKCIVYAKWEKLAED